MSAPISPRGPRRARVRCSAACRCNSGWLRGVGAHALHLPPLTTTPRPTSRIASLRLALAMHQAGTMERRQRARSPGFAASILRAPRAVSAPSLRPGARRHQGAERDARSGRKDCADGLQRRACAGRTRRRRSSPVRRRISRPSSSRAAAHPSAPTSTVSAFSFSISCRATSRSMARTSWKFAAAMPAANAFASAISVPSSRMRWWRLSSVRRPSISPNVSAPAGDLEHALMGIFAGHGALPGDSAPARRTRASRAGWVLAIAAAIALAGSVAAWQERAARSRRARAPRPPVGRAAATTPGPGPGWLRTAARLCSGRRLMGSKVLWLHPLGSGQGHAIKAAETTRDARSGRPIRVVWVSSATTS